jgi:hypothetical protein
MNLLQKIENAVITLIGKINWTLRDPLTVEEQAKVRELLKEDYYIILTRTNSHLSAYAVSFGDFIIGRGWSYWSHGLMNFEDSVETDDDFRLIQSTGKGVAYATFDEVFTTSSTVLLKPKNMPIKEWTTVFDKAKSELGKPYDTLYDMAQDQQLSCVELIRQALLADPTYSTNFANFEALVQHYKRITPQMFYDCADFEIVYEIRH